MDPTALAILSIFGGAALTAGAGAVGAALQSRREHARWKRERRYEAYVAMIRFMDDVRTYNESKSLDSVPVARLRAAMAKLARPKPDIIEHAQEAIEAAVTITNRQREVLAPILLLGPDSVVAAAKAVVNAMDDSGALREAEIALRAEMRRVIAIDS
nr:hypothetical protein [Microbacterium lemovicicum]